MKVLKSFHISPFGGLNFVLQEFDRLKLGNLLNTHLPELPTQAKYQWKDILYSFWSIYFCGGDCIEDLGDNFKQYLNSNPFMKVPSPDRVLDRFKELSQPKSILKSPKGAVNHEFGINENLNRLNITILKALKSLDQTEFTLDYDNTTCCAFRPS